MEIKGLDYNTQREKLILPEYGREVQSIIDYAVALPDRAERQRCANAIIAIMERMMPQTQNTPDHKHKLWDHLALMSGFKLDIDYPYDISEAKKMMARPNPMPYPMKRIPVRHYGNMMFEIFDILKSMPAGAERDELARLGLFKQPLEFFEPDMEKFRCLALAFESIRQGGNMPCIVNAANEIVNEAFRHDRCGFLDMADIIGRTMQKAQFIALPSYDDYVSTDAEARRIATEFLVN